MASGVWRGDNTGHSDKQKTALEQWEGGNGRFPKYVLKLASEVWLGLESGHSDKWKTSLEHGGVVKE